MDYSHGPMVTVFPLALEGDVYQSSITLVLSGDVGKREESQLPFSASSQDTAGILTKVLSIQQVLNMLNILLVLYYILTAKPLSEVPQRKVLNIL